MYSYCTGHGCESAMIAANQSQELRVAARFVCILYVRSGCLFVCMYVC